MSTIDNPSTSGKRPFSFENSKLLKDIFRFRKLPYKGIAKNAERLMAAYANVNLYMLAIAGRRFCPLLG